MSPSIPALVRCFCACSFPTRIFLFFFFNDTATTEIYTLSLHDALPIWAKAPSSLCASARLALMASVCSNSSRSEEHTSELQSHLNLVCRLLLEKKKTKKHFMTYRESSIFRGAYNMPIDVPTLTRLASTC